MRINFFIRRHEGRPLYFMIRSFESLSTHLSFSNSEILGLFATELNANVDSAVSVSSDEDELLVVN